MRCKISDVLVSLSEPGLCSLQVLLLDHVGGLQSGVYFRRDHGCFIVHNGFHIFVFGIALEILELQPVHKRLHMIVSTKDMIGKSKQTM